MITVLHVQAAGICLLLLAGLNLFLPRHFGWNDELQRVSLLTRQVFHVHCRFIILTLVLMGLFDLLLADELLKPSPLAAAFLGGLGVFWGLRLVTQWFVYDRRLWVGKRFETAMHLLFSLLWLFLSGVHGLACWQVAR